MLGVLLLGWGMGEEGRRGDGSWRMGREDEGEGEEGRGMYIVFNVNGRKWKEVK